MQSLLSAPHPRELGQSFDRDSSQRSTMLSAKMLPADPQRQERHGRLPTRECVHRGDIVALHRVRWSQQSPVCGAASGGKHHSRWKVTCNIRVKCPEEGRTPKRKAGSAQLLEELPSPKSLLRCPSDPPPAGSTACTPASVVGYRDLASLAQRVALAIVVSSLS